MKHPVMHFEIMGQDAPKLGSFYADVFGWNVAAPIPNYEIQYSLVEPVPGFQRGIMGGIGKAPDGLRRSRYVLRRRRRHGIGLRQDRRARRLAHDGSRQSTQRPRHRALPRSRGAHDRLGRPRRRHARRADGAGALRLFFYGRCAEALEFYKKALGGTTRSACAMATACVRHVHRAGVSFKASDGMTRRAVDPNEGNVRSRSTSPMQDVPPKSSLRSPTAGRS